MTLGTNRKIPSFVSDCAEYFPGRFKEITNSLPSESARTRAAAGCEGKFRMGSALDGTLARLDFGSKQVAATGMKRIYADMDMQRGKDEAETKRDPFAKSTNQKPSPVRPKLEQGSYSDMNDLKSLDLKSLVIKRNELSSLIKYEGNQGKKETLERRIRLVEEELQAKRTKEAEAKEAALHKSWLDHAKQEQARVNMEKMDAAKLAVRDKNRDFSNLASTAPRSEDPYDLDVLITGTMADQPSTLKQQQQLLGCLSKNTRGAKVAKMAADGHYGTAAIQTPKLRADAQRPKRRSPIDDSNFYGNRQRPSTRSSMGMNFGSKSGSIRRRCEGCDQDCTVQPHRQDNTIYLCAMCRKNNGQTPSRPLRRSGSMSQSVTKFHKEKDGPVEILDDTTDEEPETPNKPLPIPEDISASGGIRKSLRLGASQDPLWRRLAGLKATFPKGASDAIPVVAEDISRLAPEEFLNDSVIDYYMRFLWQGLNGEGKRCCHFFNSYFYKKLTEPCKDIPRMDQPASRHKRVSRWTKTTDIFEKKFLFVPVHDALHWSLAIVCHPGGWESGGPDTVILHLDSMAGGHNSSTVTSALRSYLQIEWQQKATVDGSTPWRYSNKSPGKTRGFSRDDITYTRLKLPKQGNHTDCGLFLLTYLQYFLHSLPCLHEINFLNLEEVQQATYPEFLTATWFESRNASLLRHHIQYMVLKLLRDQTILRSEDPRASLLADQISDYEASSMKFQEPGDDLQARAAARYAAGSNHEPLVHRVGGRIEIEEECAAPEPGGFAPMTVGFAASAYPQGSGSEEVTVGTAAAQGLRDRESDNDSDGHDKFEIISHDMGKDGRGLEFQDRAEPAGSVAVVGGGGPGAAEIDGREERAEKALLLHAPVRVGEEGRGGNVGSDGEDSDSDSLHEQLGLARHRKPSNAEAQVESRAFQNRPMLDRSCRPSETQAVEDDIAYHRGILLKPGPSNVRAGDEEVPEVLAVNRKAHTRRMAAEPAQPPNAAGAVMRPPTNPGPDYSHSEEHKHFTWFTDEAPVVLQDSVYSQPLSEEPHLEVDSIAEVQSRGESVGAQSADAQDIQKELVNNFTHLEVDAQEIPSPWNKPKPTPCPERQYRSSGQSCRPLEHQYTSRDEEWSPFGDGGAARGHENGFEEAKHATPPPRRRPTKTWSDANAPKRKSEVIQIDTD